MQILMDNALESWISAISYADAIVAGKVTLKYRKNFVASLHNATELFIKQRMLNIGDHSVCKKLTAKKDPNGSLQTAFENATDLNEFFKQLPLVDFDKFYSENYGVLCDKTEELFDSYYVKYLANKAKVSSALNILKELRNNETHFFIEKWSFLKENEFEELYNFMIIFYEILQEYGLLPFVGEPEEEDKKAVFNRKPLSKFSYKEALLDSNVLRQMAAVLNGVQLPCGDDSAYEISKEIIDYCGKVKCQDKFDLLWTYVETAMHFGLIKKDDVVEEFDEPGIGRGANSYRYLKIYYR